MVKHTPGPWFVTGTLTKYVEAHIDGPLMQEIAAIGPTAADNGYGAQQIANAALIAAAPDLLDALESMVLSFSMLEIYSHQGKALESARSAIAKAKGNQP